MSPTLYAQGLLDAPVGLGMAALIGLLFGLFLEQAGFGSSRKLTAVFYFRDMSVIKVMFTAVITALIGHQYLVVTGLLAPQDLFPLETYWGAQAVGGLLFGIGFVVGGWCPGTALVGVASARWDGLVFLFGCIIGSVGFSEVFRVVEPLYLGHCGGAVRLHETLGLPERLVVFASCCFAVAVFALCTWIEVSVGGRSVAPEETRRRHRLAAAALVAAGFGLLAVPAGSSGLEVGAPATSPVAASGAPAESMLSEIESGVDHVEPTDLADRLLAGEAGLIVVDLRPSEEFHRFHLPGAMNIPLGRLAQDAPIRIPRVGSVVLCTNGSAHAAQAWIYLRAAGWTNVSVLTDGLLGFWRDVMTPPSLLGPVGERSAASRRAAWQTRRDRFLAPPTGPGRPYGQMEGVRR